MFRRLAVAFLLFAAPLHAQGTKDSALVRANKADLDSIARDKTAPAYSKRAQARIRVRDSLFLVRVVAPAPAPAPAPTPVEPPKDTVVVKPAEPPKDSVVVVKPPTDSVPSQPPVITPPDSTLASGFAPHPYPKPTNGAAFAQLPLDSVSIAVPAPTRTINVVSLQAAYDTAKTGDRLLIPRATTVVSPTFGPTARASWVTIQGTDTTSVITQLSGGAVSAVNIASQAHHIQFLGPLKITTRAGGTNAMFRSYNGETSNAQVPHHIIVNGVIFDPDTLEVRRCIWPDGAFMAVVNSTLRNCASRSGDAQGIFIANGPGPYRFERNYIEGSHQCFMSGGGDPSIPGAIPSDVVFRFNTCVKPLYWHYSGTPPNQTYNGLKQRQVKTIIETKNVRRALFEFNLLRNVWSDAQAGFCGLFKSGNQEFTAPWSQSLDITFRYNRCVNVASGLNLAAQQQGAVPMARFTAYDNVFESLSTVGGEGKGFQVLDDVRDVILMHNTVSNTTNDAFSFDGKPGVRTVIQFNVVPHGDFGVKGSGTSDGSTTLSRWMPDGLFQGNVIVGAPDCSLYPATNVCKVTSPLPLAPDGKPVGADTAKVNAFVAH
jgi:hypothetical protein